MSLLLDALKKAAEQKAKKGKQEGQDTPSADATGIDDETGLEALLGRAGDSTQTDVGEPQVPLDDGELSMPYARGDATDVRDPESLARAAFGDDIDIRQADDFIEAEGEDRIEFADSGEFGETLVDEDRTDFGETGRFAETLVDDDRSEFADTGQFGETLVDEDGTDLSETGRFDETPGDEDSTEFADSGEFGETLVDEDRTDLSETGRFDETPGDEDSTEFAETGEFGETLIDEDRTEILEAGETPAEDVTEFGETTQFVGTAAEDVTEFGDTGAEDVTEFGDTAAEDVTEFGETRVEDRTETREPTEFTETRLGEATGFESVEQPDDGAEATEYTVHFEDDGDLLDNEDRTEFTDHGLADITGFEASHGADEDTGVTGPRRDEDQTDTRLPTTLDGLERGDGDDTTGVSGEDMSLLLVEDSTGVTRRSATDPRGRDEALRALQEDRPDALSLVDTTRHQVPVDRARNLDAGGATTTSMDTQTQGREGTTRGVDPTFTSSSTTTYAPDNYDRTLMRLPSDDQSKLFPGMKPEGDVVMTPDYAKKVFRSKSTAQRWQHIRTYAAIAVIILIGIGLYGAYEYQGQSESIDTSLRPLKRDPMPGLINPQTSENLANLFAEPEVNERTIEIIESADRPDSGEITNENAPEPVAAAADTTAADTAAVAAGAAETPPPPDDEVPSPPVAQVAALGAAASGSQGATARAATGTPAARPTASASSSGRSTLEITTTSRLAERDVWLRQAWEAYQAGDDDEALRLYNQVLAVEPGNRNALLGRAAIHVHNNRTGLAMQDYRRLLEANPKDSLAMTSMLAVSNLSPSDTESQLKLMLREEPDSPYLNFALANAYGAQRRWREAQGHYFIALQSNPGDPNYAYNLAVSLEHIQQPRAAVAYYRRALENFDKGLATFSRELVNQRMEVLENL